MKKYVVGILLGLLFFVPFASNAFTSEHPGCGGDCRECHNLEKKEAEKIIKIGIPAGTVTAVKMAPVQGLWQIDFDAEGKHGIVYTDFSKKHVLLVQQIISIDTVGKPVAQKKIDFSRLPLKEALVMGPKKAKKRIVVFTDPDCPFCRKLHVEIKQVLAKRHDVAFYIFLRTLTMHPESPRKAQAILCEKSLTLLDDALAGKPLPEPSCTDAGKKVERNNALAESFQLHGTPALIREDGTVNPGYLPAEQLSSWIDGK